MDGTLNLLSQVVAYADNPQSQNPQLKYVDWTKTLQGVPVKNPKSQSYTVDPLASFTVFNGTRATSLDNTTQLQLTLSTIAGSTNRYRLAWTATGTNPLFRTDRNLTCNGHTITITVNNNGTISFQSSTVGDFAAVVVGDGLTIPGLTTGDGSSPFDPTNQGEWKVIGKDGTSTILTLQRLLGSTFSGLGQTVVVTANTQVLAYSATGVQPGDKVTISGGFPAAVQSTFTIVRALPQLVEFFATQPLPVPSTAIPQTTGIAFYTQGKRLVRVEADQECVVQANGDTGVTNRISPWAAGDPTQTGEYQKVGPMWQLAVVNLMPVQLNLTVITAE